MINKEQIQSHIELVKLPKYQANSTEKALVEYIDQLENKVKEVTDKLEKEKYNIESTYSQINGNYFMAQDKLDLINEILKILKGEK